MTRWIFLRGLSREARHWGGFPATFGAAIPGAEVVAPDLPGNGALYRQVSPSSVEAMVEAYRDELCRRGLAPPYALLALSLGAMVAVAWADRYPQEVAGLVLINTSLRRENSWHERLRPRSYPWLLRIAIADPEAAECQILALTSQHPKPAELIAAWSTYRREAPVAVANVARQLLAAGRYRGPARIPSPPILLLAAAGDRLVSAACSQRLAAAWQAALAVHPTAGHDLPLDAPAWVIDQVAAWLAARAESGRLSAAD